MLVGVLDHDDRRIHHGAEGDGDAAQAHNVGADADRMHRQHRQQHSDWQGQDSHEGAADMQQEHDAHQRDDQALLNQRALEIGDRSFDQFGPVIDRLDGDALGQARQEFGDALLDALDGRQRVGRVALYHDAAHRLTGAV